MRDAHRGAEQALAQLRRAFQEQVGRAPAAAPALPLWRAFGGMWAGFIEWGAPGSNLVLATHAFANRILNAFCILRVLNVFHVATVLWPLRSPRNVDPVGSSRRLFLDGCP